MSPAFAVRSPKPKNRIVPGPEFVYSCRAWLEREPQGWEDVASKLQQTGKELYRLERSIAFLSSRVPEGSDVASLTTTVQECLPAVKACDYQKFDVALRALFEPLAPWTAAVIMTSRESLEWQYCIDKALVQFLSLVQEEIQLHLPQDQARFLVDTQKYARETLEDDARTAQILAGMKFGGAVKHKLKATWIAQRLNGLKQHLLIRKRKPASDGAIASEGKVIIFNSRNIGMEDS